jgi:CubicO group peptidase (beta-lactamase class C family)
VTTVHGTVAPGFGPVRDAFLDNFDARGELGAAVCAIVDGRVVADLWAGEARPGVPWQADTLAVVFSTTKGPTALTIQALADRGDIDVDRRIADLWPAFAAHGKDAITVRHVLTHTSGAIDFPGYQEIVHDDDWWLDLDRIAADLERSEPAWEPGSAHGYHGVTFGLILGEVVRRATGVTLGTAFRDLIADPLDAEIWIGLPDEHDDRVALLQDPPPVEDPLIAAFLSTFTPETFTGRAHFADEDGITEIAHLFNEPAAWRGEFPSGGGIASAGGLARMYDALARGGAGVVSETSIATHTAQQVRGPDLVLLFETRFGLGYMRPTPFVNLGPSDGAFGHGGLGGSTAFADPDRRVAFAYVPNQLQFPAMGETTRSGALITALYGCLSR